MQFALCGATLRAGSQVQGSWVDGGVQRKATPRWWSPLVARFCPGDAADGVGAWVSDGCCSDGLLPWRQRRPVPMILVPLAARGMQEHSAAGSAGPADLSSWYHVVRFLLHSAHGSLVHKVRRNVGYLQYPRRMQPLRRRVPPQPVQEHMLE